LIALVLGRRTGSIGNAPGILELAFPLKSQARQINRRYRNRTTADAASTHRQDERKHAVLLGTGFQVCTERVAESFFAISSVSVTDTYFT